MMLAVDLHICVGCCCCHSRRSAVGDRYLVLGTADVVAAVAVRIAVVVVAAAGVVAAVRMGIAGGRHSS